MSDLESKKTTDDKRILPAVKELSSVFDEILTEAKKHPPHPPHPPSPPPTPIPIPPPPPTPIPPPPPANFLRVASESLNGMENTPLEITLIASDSIQGAAITFSITEQPGAGTISQDQNNSSVVTYTPNKDFTGKDIFDYQAKDDHGQISNTATIGIVVNPSPPPAPPVSIMGTVDVSNFSSATDSEIANWVAAAKIQADRDVAPIWGHSVNFNIIPKGGIPNNGNWQCGFFDNTDQPGDLGWHDAGPNGEPLIKCFVKESERFGESPSITLSHEIIESIGDANANTTVKGFDNNGRPALLFQELCDMVESNTYTIGVIPQGGHDPISIQVSDFVTPDWFGETPQAGIFDFLKVLNAPWKLAHGGYEQASYDNGQTWTEINLNNKKADLHNSEHSRWSLYKKPIEERKKSTFQTQ